ncbi:MAG: S41 family peptidase [bacterium]
MTQKDEVSKSSSWKNGLISVLAFTTVFFAISSGFLVFDKLYKVGPQKEEASRQEILKIIQKDGLKGLPSDQDIKDGELKGLVLALKDPYSSFLPKSESKAFQDSLNQVYAGVGIRFEESSDKIVVERTFKDSPAQKSGILAGDILTAVNDEKVTDKNLNYVVPKIKGEIGTSIKLTMLRNSESKDFQMKRDRVATDLIYLTFKDNVAIIQITSFGEGLDAKMKEITKQIQDKKEVNKIIIDLRGDGGGILDEAVQVISYFVEPLVGVLQEKTKSTTTEIRSNFKDQNLQKYPVAILVDGNTASASEILAGSLKDLKGSKIIGQKTFGKGVVQRIYNLEDGAQLKLTISEWLTPKGTGINGVGILPDIEAKPDQDAQNLAINYFKNN